MPLDPAALSRLLTGFGTAASAYGAGNPNYGVIGAQAINDTQRQQASDIAQRLQMQIQQAQLKRQQDADARDDQQRAAATHAFSQLLPTSAAPAMMRNQSTGASPTAMTASNPGSPFVAGMTPDQRAAFTSYGAMDPAAAVQMATEQAFKTPAAPLVRDFVEGGQTVSKQYDAGSGTWKALSSGPRFAPPQAPQLPADVALWMADKKAHPDVKEFQTYPGWKSYKPDATTKTPNIVTLYDSKGNAKSLYENDASIPGLLQNGYTEAKPTSSGGGPFDGTSMDAQTANILLTGDPTTPEYLAAYNIAAQPRSTYDPTTGKATTTTPDMSAYRLPAKAGAGVPGASATPAVTPASPPAAIPTPASAPQNGAPSVVAQAPGLTVTQLTQPSKRPATEDQAKNQQLYMETEQQLPIALKHFDELGKPANVAGASITPAAMQAYVTSPGYQQATNSIKTIVADFLYSVSGATANPGEVATRSTVVTPILGESEASKADKKARLKFMVDAIKVRAVGGTLPGDPLAIFDPSQPADVPGAAGTTDWSKQSDDDIKKALGLP